MREDEEGTMGKVRWKILELKVERAGRWDIYGGSCNKGSTRG